MKTVCRVCAGRCALEEGQTGFCKVRVNRDGIITSNAYGKVTSLALDPIEKKPLNYFYPGSRILSVGSYGCNFACPFCQNHEISMAGEREIIDGLLPILDEVLPWLDAFNIDLKGFTDNFYRMVHGELEDVKRFIVRAAGKSHVEITTLIIPGLNDTEREIEEMAEWIASVRRDIPLHLNRFFPRYKMTDREATSPELLLRLAGAARNHLEYVRVGNC